LLEFMSMAGSVEDDYRIGAERSTHARREKGKTHLEFRELSDMNDTEINSRVGQAD